MVVAVPPVPVAALGNVERLPCGIQPFSRMSILKSLERVPCLAQIVPGGVIFFVAYPDIEVPIDPLTCGKAFESSSLTFLNFEIL